ncbi:MAG TPA: penicillin-binding protein 2 [Thermoflexia bacterium]|nr:penicillin-binding protein 2 [Thermoflexia bacterium]
MAEGPRRRLRLLITLLIGLVLVIVAQLVQVQIVGHRFYEEWGREQRERTIVMAEPPRGVIRDRNGHLLAGNAVMYSIEAAPSFMSDEDKEAAAAKLGSLLHVPVAHIEQLLNSRDENGQERKWVQVASPVSKEVGEQVAALRLRGITVRPLWARVYPEGTLASHALGFCTVEITGFYGVEGFYDALLRPERVEWEGPVDSASEPIPWRAAPVALPQRGTELVLTLDRTVQALVEEELARSVQEYQAEGGTIIVMDPRTFEILAVASLPNYDPGRYVEFFDQNPPPFEDPAVSQQYEPGSVFKVLTVAAALDAGLVTPETTYYDQGWIEVGGQVIENASHQPYGQRTVADILIESLNVGVAWLSTQMGPDTFYRYVQAFGIGRPTGVDLAGEVSGQLWLPGDYEHWHPSNLGTNAFGQGLAVTPLQMIAAVAAVANDGALLRPHIVARRIGPGGEVSISQPVIEAQVISLQTARTLTEIMVRVVEEGVHQARVEGYRVAGKTGTAQIPIPGGYDKEGTITTFVGFGPVPDPQLIILVKLDRPKTSPWASETAARAFQRLATRLFVVLGIPPESVPLHAGGTGEGTVAEATR